MTERLVIPKFSDYHVHFRDGDMMSWVAPESLRHSARVMAMPNLTPPVVDDHDAVGYFCRLSEWLPRVDVRLAIKLLPSTTPEVVERCAGFKPVIAFKMYPDGVTTNSGGGIGRDMLTDPSQYPQFRGVLAALQKHNLVLSLHGEMPGQDDPFEREPDFLPFADWVLTEYPGLRVVVEHISTNAAVRFVADRSDRGRRVAATITAHHLLLHYGHMCGSASSPAEAHLGYGDGKLHPHNFCWPVVKRPRDRESLLWAATSKMPCFFLGSDSAPHPVNAKEAACGCAGVFSAPVLPEALATAFDGCGALDKLHDFVANFGDAFYGLPTIERTITLVRDRWVVPSETAGGVVPFLAGRTLNWKQTKDAG